MIKSVGVQRKKLFVFICKNGIECNAAFGVHKQTSYIVSLEESKDVSEKRIELRKEIPRTLRI